MPRPKSDDKRQAILASATAVIAEQGLGVPTATIARQAGVANGTLFTYFETKSELFNALYLDLKQEVGAAASADLPELGKGRLGEADLERATAAVWRAWLAWGAAWPDKYRTLVLLGGSSEIAPTTEAAAHTAMLGVVALLEQVRERGPMRDLPPQFLLTIVEAVAGATIEFMIRQPEDAERYSAAAFGALWRALARSASRRGGRRSDTDIDTERE